MLVLLVAAWWRQPAASRYVSVAVLSLLKLIGLYFVVMHMNACGYWRVALVTERDGWDTAEALERGFAPHVSLRFCVGHGLRGGYNDERDWNDGEEPSCTALQARPRVLCVVLLCLLRLSPRARSSRCAGCRDEVRVRMLCGPAAARRVGCRRRAGRPAAVHSRPQLGRVRDVCRAAGQRGVRAAVHRAAAGPCAAVRAAVTRVKVEALARPFAAVGCGSRARPTCCSTRLSASGCSRGSSARPRA